MASLDNAVDMSRLTILLVLLLTLLTLSLSLVEARPGSGDRSGGVPPPLPGNINGGGATDCPPGYVWDDWRQDCVRYFG